MSSAAYRWKHYALKIARARFSIKEKCNKTKHFHAEGQNFNEGGTKRNILIHTGFYLQRKCCKTKHFEAWRIGFATTRAKNNAFQNITGQLRGNENEKHCVLEHDGPDSQQWQRKTLQFEAWQMSSAAYHWKHYALKIARARVFQIQKNVIKQSIFMRRGKISTKVVESETHCVLKLNRFHPQLFIGSIMHWKLRARALFNYRKV